MSLNGVWYNELGSKVTLSTTPDGAVSGTYETAVGNVAGQYTLAGRFDTAPQSGGQAVAWAIAWQNGSGSANSATSWSGQYQVDSAGAEQIYTVWLLASEGDAGDDWRATNVGQDTFTRTQPTDDAVEGARRRGASHPL